MSELPAAIATYLCKFIAQYHCPAYLLISETGNVLDCGGDLARYGLKNIQIDGVAHEQLPFLEGLLPLAEDPLFLPFMKNGHTSSAHIHMFAVPQGNWILFLDAEDEENQQRNIQKPGNLFSLMRHQQLQLHQQPTGGVAGQVTPIPSPADNWQYAILCAHLACWSTAAPSPIPHILDAYLGTTGESIWSESGMIVAWMGETIIALFGLRATKKLPQQHAFDAGLRILERTSSLQGLPLSQSHDSWGIGIMIRSALSLSHRPEMNISHMLLGLLTEQMSALLQWVAYTSPHEILIDTETYTHLGEQRQLFVPSPLVFRSETAPQPTYSYRFKR